MDAGLALGMTATPTCASLGRKDATMSRALAFSAGGTESSRSGTSASGARPSAFSSMSGRFPGTNSRLLSIAGSSRFDTISLSIPFRSRVYHCAKGLRRSLTLRNSA